MLSGNELLLVLLGREDHCLRGMSLKDASKHRQKLSCWGEARQTKQRNSDEDCVRSCLKNKTQNKTTNPQNQACMFVFFFFVVLFLVYFVFSFSSGSCPALHEEQLEFVRTGLKNTLEK